MVGGVERTKEDVNSGSKLLKDTEASGTHFMLEFGGQKGRSRHLSISRSCDETHSNTDTERSEVKLRQLKGAVLWTLGLPFTFSSV